MKTVRIGLIGLGVVGSAVARVIAANAEKYRKVDCEFVISVVAVRDLNKQRDCQLPVSLLTLDPNAVVNDTNIDVVIEVAGGADAMLPFVMQAIANKKHVITANKALMAAHGEEILSAAKANQVWVGYEASCAGAIPIIKPLREQFFNNQINRLVGIVNGTTNFILTTMENDNLSYAAALKLAQEKGFAEADPTADVDGFDAADKALILSRLALGVPVKPYHITRRGITNITDVDINLLSDGDCRIKLLVEAKKENDEISVSVKPTILPKSTFCASMTGPQNFIQYNDTNKGTTTLAGEGAGGNATATAILQDLLDVWREPSPVAIMMQAAGFESSATEEKYHFVSADNMPQDYYVRLSYKDSQAKLPMNDMALLFQRNELTTSCVKIAANEKVSIFIIKDVSFSDLTVQLNKLKSQLKFDSLDIFAIDHTAALLLQEKYGLSQPTESQRNNNKQFNSLSIAALAAINLRGGSVISSSSLQPANSTETSNSYERRDSLMSRK